MSTVHPSWPDLLTWLSRHGMDVSAENLPVEARSSYGAGYGLFAHHSIEPGTQLFSVPATALLNSLTLAPHYPRAVPKLTCVQAVSLHLLLHRPKNCSGCPEPLFGPYISVLPQDFDSHPLTWLWKDEKSHSLALESQLISALPSQVQCKLRKSFIRFETDWKRVQCYLERNPTLLRGRQAKINAIDSMEEDYLWAWLNVNTRCVYHRLTKSPSDPDNMTLCPILDFANHSPRPPYTIPKPIQAELRDTAPSSKKTFGENFVLLSPSTTITPSDTELFLKYGAHSNSTLFTEYGFMTDLSVGGRAGGEAELDGIIAALFNSRGSLGSWMKEILVVEGYWGDWTIHSDPNPAHPSYRLITTLRLYHLFSLPSDTIPPNAEERLEDWRNTTFGKQDIISKDNEALWRSTLMDICKNMIQEAQVGIMSIGKIGLGVMSTLPEWADSAKSFVEMLWKEEYDVCSLVIESLD